MTVPAGTFKGCVRFGAGLLKLEDSRQGVVSGGWCRERHFDGKLVFSDALPKDNRPRTFKRRGTADKPLKYTRGAKHIGSRGNEDRGCATPGKVTSVTIERKLGKNVYVVEIQTRKARRTSLSTSRPDRSSID